MERSLLTGRNVIVSALAAVIATIGTVLLIDPVANAQETSTAIDARFRISAQRLENGSVRFGLRVRDGTGGWAAPVTPRVHQFDPSRATVGRWLVSSSLILEIDDSSRRRLVRSDSGTPMIVDTGDVPVGSIELRIRARLREDRRIEFAAQYRTEDGWSSDILPRARTMPAFGGASNWLSSTPVSVAIPVTPTQRVVQPKLPLQPVVDPITPVLRSGWRTGSLQYAATVNQQAMLDSILTVHSEEGPQMQVGCFGDVRRVQFVGVPFRTAGLSQLTIDGARFATNWSASTFNGSRVLRAADSERLIEHLGQAQSASLRVDSAAVPIATLNLSGLLETPIQANIDQCGNYTVPTWQPLTEAQSGRTNDGASYLVYYPQWSPLQHPRKSV